MNGFHQINNQTMLDILNQLGPGAFAVYSVLLMRKNTQTGLCFPSMATITKDSGVSLPTVKRCLSALRDKGFIDWTTGGYDHETGTNKSNSYTILK